MTVRLFLFALLVILVVGPACGGGDSTGPSGPEPTRLTFLLEPPASVQNRVRMPIQPIVRTVDQVGQAAGGAGLQVTLRLLGGGVLTGTTTVETDSSGRAVFTDIAIQGTLGSRRLVATATRMTPDTTARITLTGGVPASMAIVQGQSQAGYRNAPVAVLPAVRLRDADSNLVAGAHVDFGVVSGGGAITGDLALTNATGVATLGSWVLGFQLGTAQVQATARNVLGVSATFTTEVVPGPVAQILLDQGDGQVGFVGTTLPVLPRLRVIDPFSTSMPGLVVHFTAGGGGSIQQAVDTTDGSGYASPGAWTLTTVQGDCTIQIAIDGVGGRSPFTAHARAGPVVRLANPNDTIIGALGSSHPLAPVLAIDPYGNVISGLALHFQVTSGGGRLSDTVTVSDGNSQAGPLVWTFGSTTGAADILVTVDSVSTRILGRVHDAAAIAIAAGDSQHVVAGAAVGVAPKVRVTNLAGNGVDGALVTFRALDGSVGPGSADTLTVKTDPLGFAESPWHVGTLRIPGDHHLQVLHPDFDTLTTIDFVALVAPRPGYRISIANGDSIGGRVATPMNFPQVILVSDSVGAPMPGVQVNFAAQDGGSTAADSSVSGIDGRAIAPTWTLGTRRGWQALTATAQVTVGSPATFHVLASPGPIQRLELVTGDGQTTLTRALLPVNPTVRALDAYDNGANEFIILLPASGGGFSPVPGVQTDTAGIARIPYQTGAFPGPQLFSAVAFDNSALRVPFTATATQPPPVGIRAVGGSGQSLRETVTSPIPLMVQVVDSRGFGVPDVVPQVVVSNGSLPAGFGPTDTAGRSRADGWTLGEGAASVAVSVPGVGGSVSFSGTGYANFSSYNIEYNFVSTVSSTISQAFTDAASRWSRIILGDVPNVDIQLPRDACFTGQPAVSGVIDDLLIFVLVGPIDGRGGILGGTGVCVTRAGTGLPLVAIIQLDEADLGAFGALVPDIVLHEVGHAIGIGSIWGARGLVTGAGTASPLFTGAGARLGYWAVRGGRGETVAVPVEGTAGAGSRDVHWAEATFFNELMTPFIDNSNPLSLVTTGSLQDLGYAVDMAAADLNYSRLRQPGTEPTPAVPLREREFPGPRYQVDPNGRLIPR